MLLPASPKYIPKSITVNDLRRMGSDSRNYVREDYVRARVLNGVAFVLGAIKNAGGDKDRVLHGIIADAVFHAPARQRSKGYSYYRDIIAQADPKADYDDPVNDLIDLLYIEGCKIVEGAEAARISGKTYNHTKVYEAGLDKFEPVLRAVFVKKALNEKVLSDIFNECFSGKQR